MKREKATKNGEGEDFYPLPPLNFFSVFKKGLCILVCAKHHYTSKSESHMKYVSTKQFDLIVIIRYCMTKKIQIFLLLAS